MSAVDNGELVFHIDIFILAAIGLFGAFALPRILGRLSCREDLKNGFVFRSAPQTEDGPRRSYDSQATEVPFGNVPTSQPGCGKAASPPRHVPEWTTYAHRLSVILRYPIASKLSLGQALLLVAYFALLLYAEVYRASAFKHPIRAGFVAMSQIPLVYALATKNNAIGILIGQGYEKLNFFHQWAGILLVLAANVHAIGYIYKFVYAGRWVKEAQTAYIRWGIVALVCLDILLFFSTSIWRHKAYNIFFTSHAIALIVFLIAVPLHQKETIPYVAVAAGLYAGDLLLRAVKSRITTATLSRIPELGLTKLEIPHINAGWRAGQHVRLRILSRQMGWFGWTEMHPYTIAAASGGPQGLVVLAKKSGRWSKNLYKMACSDSYEKGGLSGGQRVKVMIEGPYGGTGHCIPASFSGALMVGGGSGITFPLAIVDDLLLRGAEGRSRVQTLHLVWVVQDSACLTPFIAFFAAFLARSTFNSFRVSIYYTGIRANLPEAPPDCTLPEGLTLTPARPDFASILDEIVDHTISTRSEGKIEKGGVLVGVCGPVALGQSVVRVVGKIDSKRRREVGGVEVHEEIFGW